MTPTKRPTRFPDGRAYVGAMVAKSFAKRWRMTVAKAGMTTSEGMRAAMEQWVQQQEAK